MIERYALYDIDKLRDHFKLKDGVPSGVKRRYNIVPAQKAPVVFLRDGKRVMEIMQWGFVSQGSKDTNSVFRYKTYTVRTEDLFKKPMWEKSVRTRRCLIPANGFYTWTKGESGKSPHFIQSRTSPLAALAGVYSSWTDSDGRVSGMFSLVTEPAGKAASEYTDQYPCVVPPEHQDMWLDPEVSDSGSIYEVLQAPAYTSLTFTPASDNIYSKKIDTPDLIPKS